MQRNYSSQVQLTKVHEGGEPAEFKCLFSFWERERLPGQVKPVANRIGTQHSSSTDWQISSNRMLFAVRND